MEYHPPSVETTINYHLPPADSGPPPAYYVSTAGSRRLKHDARRRVVTNIRGHEDEFNIDTHGFQFVTNVPSAEKTFDDDDRIKTVVYREVEKMLQKVTGATAVYVFSHVIRRDPLQKALTIPKEVDDMKIVKMSTPAWFAHVDQSYDGAWIALKSIADKDPNPDARFLPSMARNRWGIINVWRPIKTVTREPLAVCDARTVQENDLMEIVLKPPQDAYADEPVEAGKPAGRHSAYMNYKKEGEEPTPAPDQKFWQILPSAKHRWYWPSEMQPDEALLIKCFDSRTDGRARRSPHSAIITPNDHGPARESIEIRCLVFWEHQALEKDEEQARL